MTGADVPGTAKRRGGRRKGSGKRAGATAPWALRAIQALADGSRWSIIQYVSQHEATVGTVARGLGLSVACTSKHLSILHAAGLVEIRRAGREARCRLAIPGSEAAELLGALGIEDQATGGSTPDPAPRRPARQASAAPELESSGPSTIRRYKSNDIDDFLL